MNTALPTVVRNEGPNAPIISCKLIRFHNADEEMLSELHIQTGTDMSTCAHGHMST